MKLLILIPILLVGCCSLSLGQNSDQYSTELMQSKCTFTSAGENTYFILRPGYRLTLENKKGGKLVITVLYETRTIGNVETGVVEENESDNGKIVEISRNYFAFCKENSGIYYFGEQTDIYKDGKVTDHEGSWEATGNNRPGLAMPALPLLGSRYYQEIAPAVAMDRAEIISVNEKLRTPAGEFPNCLKTLETTPLEKGEKEYKLYAPGIGLVQDEDMVLTGHSMVEPPVQKKNGQ
ncbi:MAG: hypothetical protein JO053_10105 [Acidobacteria bacterium]|nr:hypothetical protein [Acidobacteriota bacterium]